MSNVDLKGYAYILHDKDIDENGEPKKPHWHLLVQFYTNQRGSWFKQFSSDDMGQVRLVPCFDPPNAFLYLTHETPTAIAQGKHIYGKDEIVSTIDNFDSPDKLDENDELWADMNDLLDGKIIWYEFIQKKPKRMHMVGNLSRTYDMLYFERYGRRFFDLSPRPQRIERRNELPKPHIEMTPITDKAELDNMPF